MKITLTIDSKHSMDISHSELSDFLSFFNDDASSSEFYSALSSHPSSQIRAEVAAKTCLPFEALLKLANDLSIEVVQRIAGNLTALQSLDVETFKTMIHRDVSVAMELARFHELSMKPPVSKRVRTELMRHSDPNVRILADCRVHL